MVWQVVPNRRVVNVFMSRDCSTCSSDPELRVNATRNENFECPIVTLLNHYQIRGPTIWCTFSESNLHLVAGDNDSTGSRRGHHRKYYSTESTLSHSQSLQPAG